MPHKEDMDVPSEIFLALLIHFDVEQDESVHPEVGVLFDSIVETVGLPCVRKEHERDRLPKVIELKPTGPDHVHDRRVMDDSDWNFQSASAEDDVGVRGCSIFRDVNPLLCFATQPHAPKWITHYKQGDVLLVRIPQNLVTFGFDHVTIREDELLSVKFFLAASLDK